MMKKSIHPLGQILTILLTLASLGMIFLKWLSLWSQDYSYCDLLDALRESVDWLGFGAAMKAEGNLVFLLSFILLLLGAGTTVVLAVMKRRGAGFPLLAAAVFAMGVILYALGWDFSCLGVGAWLCVAFAAAAVCVSYIPAEEVGAADSFGGRPSGLSGARTWACPNCGTILADRERFCPNCGRTRSVPETPPSPGLCAACGSALRAGAAFCPNCGRPVGLSAAASVSRCAACGSVLRPGAAFCPNCGQPVGMAGRSPGPMAPKPPADPAPAGPAIMESPRIASVDPPGFHKAGEDDL